MAKQVTLTLKSLTTLVSELETIKSEISSHAGTQAQRLNAARAAVKDDIVVPMPTYEGVTAYDDVMALAETIKSAADQAMDEAVTAYLAKQKDETGASLTGLRETFKAKSEQAKAVQTMLIAVGVDGAAEIAFPSLKGTGKVGSAKVANSKGQQFYRIIDGERRDQPASQNKFSSMAYYFGAAILGQDERPSSDELHKFLTAKGVDVAAGTAWSYDVSDGFTVGMDVEEVAAE